MLRIRNATSRHLYVPAHVEVKVAHHVIRVYAFKKRHHHIDPTRDSCLAIGTPRLVDEIPGEDGGVVFVNTPIHCRQREVPPVIDQRRVEAKLRTVARDAIACMLKGGRLRGI